MGFVRRALPLRFDDNPELEGLEVRARSIPLDMFVHISKLQDRIAAGGKDFTEDNAAALRELFELFVGAVQTWNLESDDDVPVPLDGDRGEALQFLVCDPALGMAMVNAWQDAIAGVSPPLNRPSSDGVPFQEESLLMEPL